ncbi:MAG: hypothetical protein DMG13_21700 [Acidobacteria bacterium]|nr:MAG: hypothetical protein DMG13_21700 [Acidobacteriota bacterium]
MERHRLAPSGAVVAGIVVTVAANAAFWNRTHSVGQAAVLAVCPGAAFAVMLLLGSDRVLERLQEWIDAWPPRLIAAPAALWLLYVIYSVGAGIAAIQATVTMAAYLVLPFLALWLPRKAPTRLWLEPLVIIWHARSSLCLCAASCDRCRCHCLCGLESHATHRIPF